MCHKNHKTTKSTRSLAFAAGRKSTRTNTEATSQIDFISRSQTNKQNDNKITRNGI